MSCRLFVDGTPTSVQSIASVDDSALVTTIPLSSRLVLDPGTHTIDVRCSAFGQNPTAVEGANGQSTMTGFKAS